ncbi:hypothetical protein PCASD_19628 [Puccinia coronata f. sp. avenae]|uniref:Uncharacterized protein n=1 Tax=Puccinia coronata f. sp. avenae TaxID=200324 RepID=A0A2N5TTV9_9BASI|nr:hypothetical protein PCASD_19628 [Puccinia coronata f. sp. avenae]
MARWRCYIARYPTDATLCQCCVDRGVNQCNSPPTQHPPRLTLHPPSPTEWSTQNRVTPILDRQSRHLIVLFIVDAIPAILDAISVFFDGTVAFWPTSTGSTPSRTACPPCLIWLRYPSDQPLPLNPSFNWPPRGTKIWAEAPANPEIVPTTFLAGPAPRLREAFLLEQDSCFFSTLPSNLLTEVDALNERIVRRQHTV